MQRDETWGLTIISVAALCKPDRPRQIDAVISYFGESRKTARPRPMPDANGELARLDYSPPAAWDVSVRAAGLMEVSWT